MPQPIGEAERAKLLEVAVVEHENEVARLVAEALQHVAMAAREIPDITGAEVIDAGAALRVNHRGVHAAGDDIGPFGGRGVPMEFSHHPRLEPHRNTGDALRDR